MHSRTKEGSRHVDAALRTLDILDCFLAEPRLSLGQIIAKTGLVRSRVMRLLGTLEHRGYIIEDAATRTYSLGCRLAGLGKSFDRANNTETLVRPVLNYLVDKTGESATFYVADGVERVALVRQEGTKAIRLSIVEGQRTPLHAGASGKVLLAFGDPATLNKILQSKVLTRITDQTVTDPDSLAHELRTVRDQGYAVSKGENIPDSYAIATPVFNYENRLVGAVGIAGPAGRLAEDEIKSRIELVLHAARVLSRRYGCKMES
jgi:DNA-binding IclR family transcriptional regulator